MKQTECLLAAVNREVERSRRALEEVPEGMYDSKPHDRSMIFGYLTDMVATIPSWIAMEVTQDELDIAPADGPTMKREAKKTNAELIAALDTSAADARDALKKTTDEHLETPWRQKARGAVLQAAPRDAMIQDPSNHWTPQPGQMTGYLRLMGAKVPSIYGPSADDKNFR